MTMPADLAALMRGWLAEDTGPDDPDIEQQMLDLDAARHSTQSLFRKEPLMPADLDALDELYRAATPGDGPVDRAAFCASLKAGDWVRMDYGGLHQVVEGWRADDELGAYLDFHGITYWTPDTRMRGVIPAALIAAAVTALPDLLRRVRLGDAAREVLEAEEVADTAERAYLNGKHGMSWRTHEAELNALLDECERTDREAAAARARYRALLETPR